MEHTQGRIIPALAGNTIRHINRDFTLRDHPRSRGEYRIGGKHAEAGQGSSPLSRGIRIDRDLSLRDIRIIPALAGNTKPRQCGDGAESDHPRSRGEYATAPYSHSPRGGSSPLSRGIRGLYYLDTIKRRIIPALAGNTLAVLAMGYLEGDHPRSRGEYTNSSPSW